MRGVCKTELVHAWCQLFKVYVASQYHLCGAVCSAKRDDKY